MLPSVALDTSVSLSVANAYAVSVTVFIFSCSFIFDADFSSILMRLVHSLRGVGNPLVAAYGRLYLSRMAARVRCRCCACC